MVNGKYFDAKMIPSIKQMLETADESLAINIMSVDFKDPTTLFLFSFLLGAYGVDRFMLGDVGMGVLKLLTGGLCGILWIIDMINIQQKTKDYNLETLRSVIASPYTYR